MFDMLAMDSFGVLISDFSGGQAEIFNDYAALATKHKANKSCRKEQAHSNYWVLSWPLLKSMESNWNPRVAFLLY